MTLHEKALYASILQQWAYQQQAKTPTAENQAALHNGN